MELFLSISLVANLILGTVYFIFHYMRESENDGIKAIFHLLVAVFILLSIKL